MMTCTATQFDLFSAPATVDIGTVRGRDRAAIRGCITELTVEGWDGGTSALHATVTDATGSLTVAFLGRSRVAGLDLGSAVVVAGAAVERRGRVLMMNPYVWLAPPLQVGTRARVRSSPCACGWCCSQSA